LRSLISLNIEPLLSFQDSKNKNGMPAPSQCNSICPIRIVSTEDSVQVKLADASKQHVVILHFLDFKDERSDIDTLLHPVYNL